MTRAIREELFSRNVAGSRRQDPEPTLDRPGLRQDVIDRLERQVLDQLAQITRSENASGDRNGMRDCGSGRLSAQRDYTLIPLDQPGRLVQVIWEFTHASGTAALQQAAV